MTENYIIEKFLSANRVPSKNSIQDVLGFSAQTLVRKGFTMSEIKKKYLDLVKVPKPCPCCGSEVMSKVNTYCSSSCAAKTNSPKRVKRVYVKCLYCNKTLVKRQTKYCSNSCQHKYTNNKFIEDWLRGEDVGSINSNVSDRIRQYLFERYNNKCSKCGWGEINPITKRPPLEVEHIDGNSENNSNDNLTLLCPNCHSLTTTYKALNKGSGRYKRMQRYNEGKSY